MMATVKPIKPEKPFDRVAHEPVMLALSKARALAWFLERLGEDAGDSELRRSIEASSDGGPDCIVGWVQMSIANELRRTHDDIEQGYRKLGTNLLAKKAAAIRKTKDGA